MIELLPLESIAGDHKRVRAGRQLVEIEVAGCIAVDGDFAIGGFIGQGELGTGNHRALGIGYSSLQAGPVLRVSG